MFALVSAAMAAPCPLPAPAAVPTLTPDGAVHVLARDALSACWWIVDDAGDARVAARWDRARKDPVALAPLADGRVAFVVEEPDPVRWRIAVRADGVPGEQRLRVDLPGRPDQVLAHPRRPLVALVWTGRDADDVWVVDVAEGRVAEAVVVPPGAWPEVFGGDALGDEGWLAIRPGRGDAPR